ncbi:hypothetical protein [Nannocystis pusilla]|uniref:hypothetical protein n=1 Tax=Nannocystis pusilla TaxID=889268 RepID=UPI003BEFEEF6
MQVERRELLAVEVLLPRVLGRARGDDGELPLAGHRRRPAATAELVERVDVGDLGEGASTVLAGIEADGALVDVLELPATASPPAPSKEAEPRALSCVQLAG